MRGSFANRRLLALAMMLLFLMASANAEASQAKPFAEEHVVLQISDGSPQRQTLVLNVASNLIKHYGPETVEVEIVAFGPGLRLLLADNSNRERIARLAEMGVRFAACSNTFAKFTSKLGQEPRLNPHARKVPAGVVRIVELRNQGYHHIKP